MKKLLGVAGAALLGAAGWVAVAAAPPGPGVYTCLAAQQYKLDGTCTTQRHTFSLAQVQDGSARFVVITPQPIPTNAYLGMEIEMGSGGAWVPLGSNRWYIGANGTKNVNRWQLGTILAAGYASLVGGLQPGPQRVAVVEYDGATNTTIARLGTTTLTITR